MHEQKRDRRRRDAGNARRLPDRLGLVQVELVLDFRREAANCAVVETERKPQRFVRASAHDLIVLPIDVACVLDRDLDLRSDVRISDTIWC